MQHHEDICLTHLSTLAILPCEMWKSNFGRF